MTTPKPLVLIFSLLDTQDPTSDETQIIRKEDVYFWPTFSTGEIITLNVFDAPNGEIAEVKSYKVVRTSFIIGVNSSNNENSYTSLLVYVKEHVKTKAQEGGPEIEFI